MKPDIGHTQLIIDECQRQNCTLEQAAYLLATAWHETAETMKPVEEAFWMRNADDWRRRNLRYYPWHGRGFVQLTWEENYRRAQDKTGVPVHDNPDMAMRPDAAAAILVRGCMEGWFTGKSLGDYVNARKVDYLNARRVVNGTDKAAKIETLAKGYEKLLRSEGYGKPVESVVPEGLDKPLTKSKTIGAGGSIGACLAVKEAFPSLPLWAEIALFAVILGLLGIIVWERIRYRNEAARRRRASA